MEEEFVASQILRYLEKDNANAIVNSQEVSDEYLYDALKSSIKDIEDGIANGDTVENTYIKREYIRMLKSFLNKPESLKEIYQCVREYFKQEK